MQLNPIQGLRNDFAGFTWWQVILSIGWFLLAAVFGVVAGIGLGFLVMAYA